jgi:NAD(P)-dependent dehydrogenase (short-subunit alcohol dehydrogenase family)
MDLQLAGRRAVVTGGSKGIGKAVANALANEGCDVGLVARGEEALAAAADELTRSSGRKIVPLPADTGSDESVAQMARRAHEQLGGVDILVNAAATPSSGLPLEVEGELAVMEKEFNVKVLGYLRCARAFAPGMAAAGWGRIINISGLAARRAFSVPGSVRNVAVSAMTKNLADELGASGINVTVVHPGTTRTERTPANLERAANDRGVSIDAAERAIASGIAIGRIVTAAEVANVVAFLASPLSVPITGDAIPVGGGSRGSIHY